LRAEYVDVARARALPGLRLVLTAGMPGPWGEAAKGLFHAKGIPFARVAQQGGADNDELHEWTGHRNAPVAVYENEPPRTGWAEILWLAERLRPEPALVPADPDLRVECFGLAHELLGENGFGWCRRLMLFRASLGETGEPSEAMRPVLGRMLAQYGYSRAAADAAPARVAEILALLARRLATQRAAGRRYLVGDRLSAVDIHWAAMAALVAPLPPEVCAMPDPLRKVYSEIGSALAGALDPALLAHRDHIYREHMEFPVAL
jgi:glutathione S-transferase